jgi:hypothetical protein
LKTPVRKHTVENELLENSWIGVEVSMFNFFQVYFLILCFPTPFSERYFRNDPESTQYEVLVHWSANDVLTSRNTQTNQTRSNSSDAHCFIAADSWSLQSVK